MLCACGWALGSGGKRNQTDTNEARRTQTKNGNESTAHHIRKAINRSINRAINHGLVFCFVWGRLPVRARPMLLGRNGDLGRAPTPRQPKFDAILLGFPHLQASSSASAYHSDRIGAPPLPHQTDSPCLVCRRLLRQRLVVVISPSHLDTPFPARQGCRHRPRGRRPRRRPRRGGSPRG